MDFDPSAPSTFGVSRAAALSHGQRLLADANVAQPAADARRLLRHVLQVPATELIVRPDLPLTPAEQTAFDAVIARRACHEPVSRIEGRREFFGRSFQVTPSVLDPRPETETVVEAALAILCRKPDISNVPPHILDIGTGSGCILLSLLAEVPDATGTGIDVSQAALEVAAENAVALGVGSRAKFVWGDLQCELPSGHDIWVSNPPYIPAGDIAGLEMDVRCYDPLIALDGGCDGLDAYRAMLQAAANAVDPPAHVVLEAGAGQAAAITQMAVTILGIRLANLSLATDLCGHSRCVAIGIHRR